MGAAYTQFPEHSPGPSEEERPAGTAHHFRLHERPRIRGRAGGRPRPHSVPHAGFDAPPPSGGHDDEWNAATEDRRQEVVARHLGCFLSFLRSSRRWDRGNRGRGSRHLLGRDTPGGTSAQRASQTGTAGRRGVRAEDRSARFGHDVAWHTRPIDPCPASVRASGRSRSRFFASNAVSHLGRERGDSQRRDLHGQPIPGRDVLRRQARVATRIERGPAEAGPSAASSSRRYRHNNRRNNSFRHLLRRANFQNASDEPDDLL
jgi:hypothetical protein